MQSSVLWLWRSVHVYRISACCNKCSSCPVPIPLHWPAMAWLAITFTRAFTYSCKTSELRVNYACIYACFCTSAFTRAGAGPDESNSLFQVLMSIRNAQWRTSHSATSWRGRQDWRALGIELRLWLLVYKCGLTENSSDKLDRLIPYHM